MNRRYLASLVIVGSCIAITVNADTVYRNTGTSGSHLLVAAATTSGTEDGNQITLAGSARDVRTISFHIHAPGLTNLFADLHIRFYANDGPSGQPGTLLWDSGPVHCQFAGSGQTVGMAVPFIVVPNSFTWTAQLTGRTGNSNAVSTDTHTPPQKGSAPLGFWRKTGPNPADWTFMGTDAPFSADIIAYENVDSFNACDTNCDATINAFDIQSFINIISGANAGCSEVAGDTNLDGSTNGFDIQGFVDCIS